MSMQKLQAKSVFIGAITGRKLNNIVVIMCILVKLLALYILLNDSIITKKMPVRWGFPSYLEREGFLYVSVWLFSS